MTEKELKKLNRKQLLEMLLIQTKRADELEERLAEVQKALDDREITLSKAGSIADAALRLNGIFEAADAAAKQYLDNIKRLESALSARALVSGVDPADIPPTPVSQPISDFSFESSSDDKNDDTDFSDKGIDERVSTDETQHPAPEDDIPKSVSELVPSPVSEPIFEQENETVDTIFCQPEKISEIKVLKPRGDKKCKTKKILITKETARSTGLKNIPPEQNSQKPKV